MIIYKQSGDRLADVQVEDNSYRHRAIMGDNTLTLYFSLPEHLEIPVGAYCVFGNERYTLERPEALKMHHTRYFEYTVIMESVQTKAKIWKFRNPVDGRLKFSLTATPREHLQMFVDNMNMRDTGWSVGKCIDGAEQVISYDHAFCWDALGQMAEQFKTEFEIVGKRVSLCKVEYSKANPLPLSYGRGNGFVSGVGRSNYGDNPPIEILYVQGGEKNIDHSKYGSAELHLPRGGQIAYDGEHFEDETGFIANNARQYVADVLGQSVRRKDKALRSLAEESLDCSSIYPKRVGQVSEVVCVDAEHNFYDIIDITIPDSLDYEECLIEGETMTVIFQDGMLAGKEFDVKYCHQAKTVNGVAKKARRFEIVPQEIDGQTMPNSVYAPVNGNKYAVFHCMLPQAYINAYTIENLSKTGAEWDMMRQAVKHLYANEEQQFSFSGTLDGIWAKKDWENIGGRIILGGFVLFTDNRFQKEGVRVRIIGIKDYINNPHSPEIELSNSTVTGSFSTKMQTIESTEVVIDENHRNALQFTKRRFRDAKETILMLGDALLHNFSNSINPITVQTMMMLLGDENLQFRFVDSTTNPAPASHHITYDAASKQLRCPKGTIQHLTLGIGSVSSAHNASEYKYWNIPEYISGRLDDADTKYYLYAVCEPVDNGKTGNGVFRLEKQALSMTTSGKVNLLVGVLNSEYDGERSFVTLYGFTEVLPGRITTDKIVSADGKSWIDLLSGAMQLGEKLKYADDKLILDFLFSEGANIGGWIFKNNRLESQNGNVFLDGKKGEVRLKGTLQLSTGFSGNFSDVNLFYIPATKTQRHISMGKEWEDIGKVCRLYNSGNWNDASIIVHTVKFLVDNIGNGFSNENDGSYITYEIRPQEILELTCFELPDSTDTSKYGYWVATNRFSQRDFLNGTPKGRFPLLLACGGIYGTDSGCSISGTFYDGRRLDSLFTGSRQGTGIYRFSFASGLIPNGYIIMATGTGNSRMKATVRDMQNTYFEIEISDDASANDGGCIIMIFAPSWEYNMTK